MKISMILAILIFYPFAAGLVTYVSGIYNKESRNLFVEFIMISEFLLTFFLLVKYGIGTYSQPFLESQIPGICGFGLHFTLDGFRTIYVCIAAWMWMMAAFLCREYLENEAHQNRFYLFLLLTMGATIGVFLSADLYTMFIFFEIMSFTSYVWVAQEETEEALHAADTYLAIAVMGGLVMLMGLFLLYHELGTLSIAQLLDASAKCGSKGLLYVAGGCLFVGFGAKAGAFPLHVWLPKAHPVAPAPASALLSGILTKTGIFGILIISSQIFLKDAKWGMAVLLVGLPTMFFGALLALFSVDMKRILACSSMSQIGFILVGIGMQGILGTGNALAVHGTFLHMINHSLIKLVLFLTAGVVFMNTHALNLNQIRGFGRKKPLLKCIFLTGALAIAGIPFFGGYISKTLLHESILAAGNNVFYRTAEVLFLVSGGITVAYMLKLYVALFVEENEKKTVQDKFDQKERFMGPFSSFALTASAVVLLIWGLFPHLLMDRAASFGQKLMNLESFGEKISYFTLDNLKGTIISVLTGIIIYIVIVRKLLMKKSEENGILCYVDRWPLWLDLEEKIYRPVLLKILPFVTGVFCRIFDSLPDGIIVLLRKTVLCDSPIPHERTEGNILTEIIGRIMNLVQSIQNHTVRRKNPVHKDYVHIAAVKNEEFKENNLLIQRSLSFGLLLFCIGLSLTLFYIIWW